VCGASSEKLGVKADMRNFIDGVRIKPVPPVCEKPMKLCGLERIYAFRYLHPVAVYRVNQPALANVPLFKGGGVEHWSITPPLPKGLKFERFTGVITGVCSKKIKRKQYTVTAKNWHGVVSTIVSIVVKPRLLSVSKGCACTGVVLGHSKQGGSCKRWGADKHPWCFVSKQCRTARKSQALVDHWSYCDPASQLRLLQKRKHRMEAKGYIPLSKLKGAEPPKQAHFKIRVPVELSAAEGPLGLSVSGNGNGQHTEGQCEGCMYGTRGVCHKMLTHHIDNAGVRSNKKAIICSGERFKGVCPVHYSLCRSPLGLQYVVHKADIHGDAGHELRLSRGLTKVHLRYDTPMLPLYPTTDLGAGGAVVSFAVKPALPKGVMLDSKSGVISGTPLKGANMLAYTITAANGMGNCSYTLNIRVRQNSPAPTSAPTAPPTYPEALVDKILTKKYPLGLCKKCDARKLGLPEGPCKKTVSQKVPPDPKHPNATATFKNVQVCAETSNKTEDTGKFISACPAGFRRCYYPPLALTYTLPVGASQHQQKKQQFLVRVGETLQLTPQVAGKKTRPNVGGIRFAVMPELHRGLQLDSKTGIVSGVPMQDRAQLAALNKLRDPDFRGKELVRRKCTLCSKDTAGFCQKIANKRHCVVGERGLGCPKSGTTLDAGSIQSCTITCPDQYELCTELKGEKEEYIIVASNSGGAVHTKIAITFNEPRTPAPTVSPTLAPTKTPTHSPTKPGFMVHIKTLQTQGHCRGCHEGPGGPCKRLKTYTSSSSEYSTNQVECMPYMGHGEFVGSLAAHQAQCPDLFTECTGDETYRNTLQLAPVCLCRVNLADKAYPTAGQLCKPHGANDQRSWCYVDSRCQIKESKTKHGMAWSHCNIHTQRELKAYIDRDTCGCNGEGDYDSSSGLQVGAKCWQWDTSSRGAWCYVDEKCQNSNGRRNGKYWKKCTIPAERACDCNGLTNKQKWGGRCQQWGFDPMEWCFVSKQCPLASPSQERGLHWAHCGSAMKKLSQGVG
jgi:hypothetical protein